MWGYFFSFSAGALFSVAVLAVVSMCMEEMAEHLKNEEQKKRRIGDLGSMGY